MNIGMKLPLKTKNQQKGFTIVEIATACVIFPIIVVSVYTAFKAVLGDYARARQFNDMYAVLSACPEIDRALDYDIVTGSNNCYPNNTFYGENGGAAVYSYSPSLTVTPTRCSRSPTVKSLISMSPGPAARARRWNYAC
jgi:hypothetical protein